MGKYKYLFLSILLLLSILSLKAYAAPAEWGIAINETTQECAGYWAGDEFSLYSLPEGWVSYTPDYDEIQGTYIDTPLGICDFSNHSEQACCEQLNLPYISDQIGEYKSSGLCLDCQEINDFTPIILTLLICCCLSLVAGVIAVILIIKLRK